jgi:hypothetical protein
VLAACNDKRTYEAPLAAEAYSYLHLLERYRRTWDVLIHLVELGRLPLGAGVAVLDVGTGPAPALYAISDFYMLLRQFGDEQSIPELSVQGTKLHAIEESPSWLRFVHHFSEHARREEGPFGATFLDFKGLNLRETREALRQHLLAEEEYDEREGTRVPFRPPAEANEEAMAVHRYRLVVISNFLTLAAAVDTFRQELVNLFVDLNPGSLVVVMGGYRGEYQEIYRQLQALATSSGLDPVAEAATVLGEGGAWRQVPRIKASYRAIYRHLVAVCGKRPVRRVGHPDFEKEGPKLRFGLRVFRKNRWSHGTRAI